MNDRKRVNGRGHRGAAGLFALLVSIEPTAAARASVATPATRDEAAVHGPAEDTGADYASLARFQGVRTRAEVAGRLKRFLARDAAVAGYVALGAESFMLYATPSPTRAADAVPEFVLALRPDAADATAPLSTGASGPAGAPLSASSRAHREPSERRASLTGGLRGRTKGGGERRPLEDLRVGIDPGHFGGPLARLEERYIDMKPSPRIGGRTDLQFDEGSIAFLAARRLAGKLTSAGAIVRLTRAGIGRGALTLDFEAWRRASDFDAAVAEDVAALPEPAQRDARRRWWRERAPARTIFRDLYRPRDLRARAALLNAFAPDVTVIIHFNGGGDNDPVTGQNLGTEDDRDMAFIPGAFFGAQLRDRRTRFEFARLVAGEDLTRSARLGDALLRAFNARLPGVPPAGPTDADYLARDSMPSGGPGVFSRNLVLTRLVRGTLVYGESLYQDNFDEARRLAAQDVTIGGVRTSSRVAAVADAYLDAILAVYAEGTPATARAGRTTDAPASPQATQGL